MKKFLAGNIQDEHIEEMLKLREDTLRKREFNEMKEANVELENKTISEQVFMFKVVTITSKYSEEKMSIEKTKEDISKGHQAALKLTK